MDETTKDTNEHENKKRDAMRRELELELEIRELKQRDKEREHKYKEMLAKKDGHIEALQTNILISQKQHVLEMQKVKDSFKNEFSRLQELMVKSMNDRIDEKIEFRLEQQSDKFEAKIEDTTANIEDKLDILDQKFDNFDENVDDKIDNVDKKVDELSHTSKINNNTILEVTKTLKAVQTECMGKIRELQSLSPRYHNSELVRFAEEGSSGVTFSPSGDSITCSSSEGGACLNFAPKESDTGKYEWLFKYENNKGSGDVWFGYCSMKQFPSSWDLNCKDTCLWSPEKGNIYTDNLRVANPKKAIEKGEGILRFVLDLDDKNDVDAWVDGSDKRIGLWHKGPKTKYPCVCFKNNSKHKVTLLSFKKL